MMKDSIFTPGPWDISWGTYQDGEGHEVCEYRKQGQPLACIAKVNFHDDHEGETKANARLIAASPTLYAYVSKLSYNGDMEAAELLETLGL
jgi:hypothetical protein